MPTNPSSWSPKQRGLALFLLALVGALVAELMRGVLVWIGIGAFFLAGWLAIRWAFAAVRRRPLQSALSRFSVFLVSLFLMLALVEFALFFMQERWLLPMDAKHGTVLAALREDAPFPDEVAEKVERMQASMILPLEWNMIKLRHERQKGVYGTPFLWHGARHALDRLNMRRRGEPFPERDPERFRVAVFGDSFTYGWGVPADWSYPAQLERLLAPDFDVEVINLGGCGHASTQVLEMMQRFLPELTPDLVVYGLCLNDFLPLDLAEPTRLVVPMPAELKEIMLERTRLGPFCEQLYRSHLQNRGLRPDFYARLWSRDEFPEMRARLGREVAEMNELVLSMGLPPVVAFVLDEAPRAEGPKRELVRAAEAELGQGGMQVLSTDEIYRRFDGCDLRVSRWEGHPNELAYAVYARLLHDSLRGRKELQPFGRSTSTPAAPAPRTSGN